MPLQPAADFIGKSLGRFRIERRIGSGGMGVVYEATDTVHRTRVALKTLGHLEPEALYRLKSEFRSLAGVLHPNLVQMHELACEEPHWFFVMDFIEGQGFLQFVRQAASGHDGRLISTVDVRTRDLSQPDSRRTPYSTWELESPSPDRAFYERLRLALRGVLLGVSALHDLGKLHRDLKPSNVLVTPKGRAVILDFGLTSDELPTGTSQREFSPRGTPLYMAPELFLGDAPSKAADYYAIGVMLYEALVGRPPFDGASHQLVSQKLYGELAPPVRLVPGTPQDLSELCLTLLERDPHRRAGARELFDAFRDPDPSPSGATSSEADPDGPRSTRFIGREAELHSLRAAFDHAMRGHTAIITICGESGLGKSALVSAFLREATGDPQTLVLSGRCYEHESVPYKAFDQIADALSSYLADLSDSQLAELIPRDPTVLATLFPVLARVSAFRQGTDESSPADPTELRLRGFSALQDLLRRLARTRRLILTVDDLHWADGDSALVFKELFSGATSPPCLVLATSRDETPPALQPLLEVLDGNLTASTHVDQLELNPLSEEEMRELARSVQTQQDEARVRYISEEARGNPFFVLALSRRSEEPSRHAGSLPSLMQGWLMKLPASALNVLRLIAVAGRPIEESLLASVLDNKPVSEDLFLLSREHYIGAWPTPSRRVECYHDRIREAALSSLDGAQMKQLHAELGEVLEALGGADYERLAAHFFAAGRIAKASRYAERAADEAAGALAFLHSAHWYERALAGAAEDPERRTDLLGKLGEAYAGAGQGVMAAERLLQAVSGSQRDAALKLRQRAAELLLVSGHIDRGVTTLEEVLQHIKMRLAKTPRRALLSLIQQRAKAKLRGLGFVPTSPDALPEGTLLKIDACWSVALGLSLVDPIRAADFQTRNLLLSLDAGDSYRVARALAMEAGFVAAGGSRAEQRARALSDRARALADEVGSQHAIGLSTFTAGLARYLVGDWPEAIRLFARAEALLIEVPGAIWELNATQRFRLHSEVFRGDLCSLAERIPELLRLARERGNLYAECNLRVRGTTVLALVHDDPVTAERETKEVMSRWSQDGFHLQHYSELVALLNCEIYRGDAEAAMKRIRETWPRLEASLLTNTQAVRVESKYYRTRACLAYLGRHPEDKATWAQLRADIRSLRREKVGWGTAFASFAEALGHAHAAPEMAIAGLAQAEQEYLELQMHLLAQVCAYRRGQLLGGEEGNRLIDQCRDFLRAQAVHAPDRYAAHLAPMPRS